MCEVCKDWGRTVARDECPAAIPCHECGRLTWPNLGVNLPAGAAVSLVQPSQQLRRVDRPRRQPGQRYAVTSFSHAVRIACGKAGCVHWSPHQLRHSAADRIEREFGPEVARVILGHSTISTTQIYLTDDIQKAIRAIQMIG